MINAKCKSKDILQVLFDRNVHVCKYNLVPKGTVSLIECLNNRNFMAIMKVPRFLVVKCNISEKLLILQ